MPELPEAETIVRDLRSRIVGRTILRVLTPRPDVLAPDLGPARLDATLRGRRIDDVARRGKNVLLVVEGAFVLRINLGMTGRLVVGEAPSATELRHVAVRFELTDGGVLLYDDVRRFGRIALYTRAAWRAQERTLGLEPLSAGLTPAALHALLAASRTPIRTWLLDQRRIAGIGNIYANEALFRAGIDPRRPANSLGPTEASRLRTALRAVLRAAIAARGTTVSDYRDAQGEAGGFGPRLEVYDSEGEPCPRCGTPIERIVITNRSAFLCPRCQR